MLTIIQNDLFFLLSLAFVVFAPGYSLVLAIFGKSTALSSLERFVLSAGIGIVGVDFLNFAYSKLNIPLTQISEITGIVFLSAVCYGIYKFRNLPKEDKKESDLFHFSKNQFILILLLIFLTFFIKTVYLSGSIAPTATDMGHHLYWTKLMTETHTLPTYDGMPDFIIGEHVVLGVIQMISGADFFSAFPVLFLLFIDMLGIFTVFILTLRLFGNKTIAILTLLFLGVLYAVSSPQAKFVSGGVMGNIFGNFLMPLAIYLYLRAFSFLGSKDFKIDKYSKTFLSLAIFITFGLFYTHHLTSFIFLFVFALLVPIFIIVNYKDIEIWGKRVSALIFSPWVLGILALCLFFFFFVFTPTYIRGSAVGTAVGAPSKETRVGLTLDNIKSSIGEARLDLGFLGLIILILSYRKKSFGYTAIAAWAIMIFIMSTYPKILFVNLPSTRIGNYLSYPLAILSAYGLYGLFSPQILKFSTKRPLPENIFKTAFILILTFVLIEGIADSASAFKKQDSNTELAETFNASAYLVKNTTKKDILLKDHNYITADSWIKLFFMRGYTYPQSRGYFKRYEDPTKPREMCTLYMISDPAGEAAKACFEDSKTNFLMVNPRYDSGQFQRLSNFNQVYVTKDIAVYYRK
jgi:hypothetical protein